MDIKTYLASLTKADLEDYARRCGTTVAYLRQLSGGFSQAGPALAVKLSNESGGLVPLEIIRPDIWGRTPPPTARPTLHLPDKGKGARP